MANLSKIITFIVGICTFIIIFLLGILAEISWSVILIRTVSAVLVVSSLTYATCFLLYNLVIKDNLPDEDLNSNFDFTADEDININNHNIDNMDNTSQSLKEDSQTDIFKNFKPTQINSSIEDMINQDPQKAADILRQMGLDE